MDGIVDNFFSNYQQLRIWYFYMLNIYMVNNYSKLIQSDFLEGYMIIITYCKNDYDKINMIKESKNII